MPDELGWLRAASCTVNGPQVMFCLKYIKYSGALHAFIVAGTVVDIEVVTVVDVVGPVVVAGADTYTVGEYPEVTLTLLYSITLKQ